MTTGEFFNLLAVTAGIDQDSPELKLILADPSLSKIEVPKEFENLVGEKFKGMVTLEAAKQNPDLKKYFTYSALSGIDSTIERLGKDEFGMDDEYLAALKKQESTGKRLIEFSKKIKELSEKKHPVGDDDKSKKLQAEIARLNQQFIETQEKFNSEKQEIANRFLNTSKERALKDLFQKYEYTDTLPKSVQNEVARSLFNGKLKENNYKVTFDENGDNPRLLTDQDTEVFVNNKAVNLQQYLDKILAENNLLKVTAPVKQNGNGKGEPIIVPASGEHGKINNSAFLAELEVAAQDMARKS